MKKSVFAVAAALGMAAVLSFGSGTAMAQHWGHGRYHDELGHRDYHRHLEHRDAHRYPITPRQHGRLHDHLDHDAYHDRLEHRQYHRYYRPYRGWGGYGHDYPYGRGYGFRAPGLYFHFGL
ncbi:MAG: hypothetical protein ACYC0X_22745 [Pirellulaceae bacterium]